MKAALVTRVEKDRLVLTFPAPVPAMEDKTVRVQVEVRGKTPVKYSLEPVVVVEGKFAALEKDPYGRFYRVTDALPMPRAGLRRCE